MSNTVKPSSSSQLHPGLPRRAFLRLGGLALLGWCFPRGLLAASPPRRFLDPDRLTVPQLEATRWRKLVVHHSATANGNAAIFDRHHRDRRRMEHGLAYHFIIGNGTNSRDGQIEVGPRWTAQLRGGHLRSLTLNEHSIGICLVGNFEKTKPTPHQLAALLELLQELHEPLLPHRPRVWLHRELPGERTVCPGRHFPARWLRERFA